MLWVIEECSKLNYEITSLQNEYYCLISDFEKMIDLGETDVLTLQQKILEIEIHNNVLFEKESKASALRNEIRKIGITNIAKKLSVLKE